MIKKFILTLLLLSLPVWADIYSDGYISPESYAVNEADLTDYRYVPSSPKLDIDTLESVRFKESKIKIEEPNKHEKNITKNKKKEKEVKKQSSKQEGKSYEKRLSYKFAKWWVEQRYKREEPHHGVKHEIKIKAREEYEKRQLEMQGTQTN